MKYLKKFENYGEPEDELIDKFSSKFIEKYYQDNYMMTNIIEVLDLYPRYAWKHIDDDKFVKSYIEDEIANSSFEDFSDYDYKKYIEDNWTDIKEKKVIEIYNKKNDEDEDEYGDYMLNDLDEDELRKVISEDNEENSFIDEIITDRYDDKDAEDIITEIYGNAICGKNLYNIISYYVDDEELMKDYESDISYDDKVERVKEEIYRETKLQQKLLKIDSSNVLLLGELFANDSFQNHGDNISGKYSFQKLYIEKYATENTDEPIDKLKAKALKFINDNFELNSKIETEYSEYMWLVSGNKYNL